MNMKSLVKKLKEKILDALDSFVHRDGEADALKFGDYLANLYIAACDEMCKQKLPVAPTQDVIERVARALAACNCKARTIVRSAFGEEPEDETVCINMGWNGYIPEAKAVLAAMGDASTRKDEAPVRSAATENALQWFEKLAAEYTGFGASSAAMQPAVLRAYFRAQERESR